MNSNNSYPLRRVRTPDSNHWYSSTYWRSNRHKINNCRPPGPSHHSNAEKVSDNLNIVVQSDGYSFTRSVRPYSDSEPLLDSRQLSVKRLNDCIEQTTNQKRLRMRDPFESPNSLIKDFRLTDTNGRNSADFSKDLFCEKCQTQCHNSLDYSNHLSGRRHKANLEVSQRSNQTHDYNQLHRLLKQSKEAVVGLNYIKETKLNYFACDLCKCYEMTVNNTVQHIRGLRHQRNFTAQKESEDRKKRSAERQKRPNEKRSICSATQTCDTLRVVNRTHTPMRSSSNATPNRCSPMDMTDNKNVLESDFEKLDSCKKTIENFRTIREICDQMIGYFSEKQKSSANMSPKSRSSTGRAFECLALKIKREN